MKHAATVVLGLVCLGAIACGEPTGPSEPGPAAAGEARPGDATPEMAPAFVLDDLDGESLDLATLRGKTVIVDFWATWCPPCEFQVPELNAFLDAHREEGDVEVLGISVDTEGPDVVGQWVRDKGVRYRILLGDEALAREYGAQGFPTLVIIDPDGKIDSRHVGLIETDDLEEALARLR